MTMNVNLPDQIARLPKHDREDSAVDVNTDTIWVLYYESAPIVSLQLPATPTTVPIEHPTHAQLDEPNINLTTTQDVTLESKDEPIKLMPPLPSLEPSEPPQFPDSNKSSPPIQDIQQPKKKRSKLRSAYHTTCTFLLGHSILLDGENLLVRDPAAVDALLTCIGAVSETRRKWNMIRLNLVPGCPIYQRSIRNVLNSFPALHTLVDMPAHNDNDATTTTTTMPAANKGKIKEEGLHKLSLRHRRLLNWVLNSPLTHLATASPTRLPTLLPTGIHAYQVTHQPLNKEALFSTHSKTEPPFPVFHGTCPSRIPLILTHGLRNMSHTRYQAHGRAMGPGIYLATDSSTSLAYSYTTPTWQRSQFSTHEPSVKVLLGCELAGERRGGGTYVIQDESKVVVRFLFLFPGSWRCDGVAGLVGDLETVYGVLRQERLNSL